MSGLKVNGFILPHAIVTTVSGIAIGITYPFTLGELLWMRKVVCHTRAKYTLNVHLTTSKGYRALCTTVSSNVLSTWEQIVCMY